MEKKNFVCIRLTKSSQMTVKDTIGRMCHDIRATRPGYLRDDPEAKCYWFPEKEKGQGVRKGPRGQTYTFDRDSKT